MNCLNVVTEIVRDCPEHVRKNVNVEGVGDMALVIFANRTAITFMVDRNATIRATLPDSLASHFDSKAFDFDLHKPSSIQHIQQLITSMLSVSAKFSDHIGNFLYGPLTEEDRNVIVDLFQEKLPMVWQDAVEELKSGVSVSRVVNEMRNGHIIRILRKMGYDVESWVKEFEEFHA